MCGKFKKNQLIPKHNNISLANLTQAIRNQCQITSPQSDTIKIRHQTQNNNYTINVIELKPCLTGFLEF